MLFPVNLLAVLVDPPSQRNRVAIRTNMAAAARAARAVYDGNSFSTFRADQLQRLCDSKVPSILFP